MADIPSSYDHLAAEESWRRRWEEWGIYLWDRTAPREATFVVDTPPPTVSGSLHVGHVFSYTHQDVLVRYQRMTRQEHRLPDGLGRQRPAHRAAGPELPRHPLQPAPALRPRLEADRRRPRQGGDRGGLAPQLHRGVQPGHRRGREGLRAPVAAARPVDRLERALHDHRRPLPPGLPALLPRPGGSGQGLPDRVAHHVGRRLRDRGRAGRGRGPRASRACSTTCASRSRAAASCGSRRPGRSCCRPASRWSPTPTTSATGRSSASTPITPLFGARVPIVAAEHADPEKGTGILMVCTFGDLMDVEWWKQSGLPVRQVLGRDGRLLPVAFGEPPFDSVDPAAAQRGVRPDRRVERQAGEAPDRRAARRERQRPWPRRGVAGRRSPADRAGGQVLREGRSAARVRADPPVVHPGPRLPPGAARAGREDRVAPVAHEGPLPQLGRRAQPGLVHLPPALLRRALPGLVPGARARRSRTTAGRSTRPPRPSPSTR